MMDSIASYQGTQHPPLIPLHNPNVSILILELTFVNAPEGLTALLNTGIPISLSGVNAIS